MEVLSYNHNNDRLRQSPDVDIMDEATAAAVLLSVSPVLRSQSQEIQHQHRYERNHEHDPLASLASIATMSEEEESHIEKRRCLSLCSFSSSFSDNEGHKARSTSFSLDNTDKNSLIYVPHGLRQSYNKNGRVGVYTPRERRKIIARYLSKRERRVWRKKIRYGCRKDLADQRQRFKGRFVKVVRDNEDFSEKNS